jgi:simple sugar transport system ATP-binding protein
MITHKFREVTAFADDLTVLRRGKRVGGGKVADLTPADMASMMMGEAPKPSNRQRKATAGRVVLQLDGLRAMDRSGLKPIAIDGVSLRAGEILGVAGVSGNGQMELMEILTGQRHLSGGKIILNGAPYTATRTEAKQHKVRYLPEEPLRNACAPRMSVAENLAFRSFDENGGAKPAFWKNTSAIARNAASLISAFNVKTSSPAARISSLSGGNVQRAVLARELTGDVEVLIVSNPCFGLDFAAVSTIRDRLVEARNRGVAILLISEDLDEIMELSDRIIVMSEGKIAYETPIATANVAAIGHYMAGHA